MIQFLFRLIGFVISLFFSLIVLSFIFVFGIFFLLYWLISGRKKSFPFGVGNVRVFKFGQGWQSNQSRAQNQQSWQYQETEVRDIEAEVIDVKPIAINHEEKKD